MRPFLGTGKLSTLWICLILAAVLGAAPAALAAPAGGEEAVPATPLVELLETEPAQSMDSTPVDLATLNLDPSCPLPPPPPPADCVCGGCCECNRCWTRNGSLSKCLSS